MAAPASGATRKKPHPTSGPSAPATWDRPWLFVAVLALVTLAVYWPVHRHPFFTMDDEQYVVNNAHLKASFGEMAGWAFTTYDLANWHPLTWLSHATDVHLFQLDPAGHHDVNLLFHLINALLLFWVLQRATGRAGCSFMVAAIFALHPVNVETVAWIAERKNVLSMMFFLLALGAYRWYAEHPRAGRYAVVAALYALGLMAKPQVITFPFVLLLWDYWPLGRLVPRSKERTAKNGWPPLLLEKVPLLALSAASAILTMNAQSSAGAMRYYPLSERLGNAALSYVRYIGNAFWPSRLAVFYSHPALTAANVALCLLVLLAITAFVLYRHTERYLAVGWFWFLGTLVPMIGIVQVGEQAMADRYAYLSFIGLFILLCWGVADLAERRRLSIAWVAAPSAAVLIALGTMTHKQLGYWSDNVTLWSHMLEVSGGSYEVEENLGVALLESGHAAQAMEHFQNVTALVPESAAAIGRELAGYAAVAHLYLGAYEQKQGRPRDAIAHYDKVLELAQQFASQNRSAKVPPVLIKMEAVALANSGDAYYVLGEFPQAKRSYESALGLGPLTAHQWLGLGIANQRSGNLVAAIEAYSRATRLQVSDVGFLLLAQALDKTGRSKEAETARQQARLITPDFAAAQRAVDTVLGQ